MKLHTSLPSTSHVFTGYGDGYVKVNGERKSRSVVVLPDRLVDPWDVDTFEHLASTHLESLLDLGCEVILLGTGSRQRFPGPDIMRLVAPRFETARVGLEVMDVQAACRTYNILVAEARKVAAALILG